MNKTTPVLILRTNHSSNQWVLSITVPIRDCRKDLLILIMPQKRTVRVLAIKESKPRSRTKYMKLLCQNWLQEKVL